jgi:uncharacterized protein
MDIRFTESNGKGRFTAQDGDVEAGVMVLSRVNEHLWIIEHTETGPNHGGMGVGKALVEAGVEWARANGHRFIPLCPFAKAQFDRTPAWGDVL